MTCHVSARGLSAHPHQRQWQSGQWVTRSKCRKCCQPKILHPAKLSYKNEGKIKAFPNKQNRRKFAASRAAL